MDTDNLIPFAPFLFGGKKSYSRKLLALPGLVEYWPLWEPSGSVAYGLKNGYNGTYSNVTLGQTGIGDGRTCPLFNGSSSFVNLYSAGLAGAFNATAGALALWFKIGSSGIWADGSTDYLINIAADTNNQIYIFKANTGLLQYRYRAGATNATVNSAAQSTTSWQHLALTWDKAAGISGQFLAYLNGVQVGTTQVGLGIWVGALATTLVNIGSYNTAPLLSANGYIASMALYNRALTPTEVAALAVVG